MNGRLLAAAALLALVAVFFAVDASKKMPDFEVYWRAGERAALAEPLYRAEDEHYLLKYLPAFAVMAIPLGLLPLPAAKGLWFVASAALIPVVLALSLRLLPERHKGTPALVALTVVVLAKFYAHELILGQVNLLLTAVALWAMHAGLRGRSIASGLLAALAVVLKPYALILIPWFAARRDLVALAALAGGIGCALLLPAPLYGLGGSVALHRDWWTTVAGSTAPNLLNADNVSLAAMYAKWIGPGPLAARFAAASALLLIAAAAAVMLMRRRVPRPAGLEGALLLTMMPLLSPQGWDYVFLVSTPAVMYLVNYEKQLPAPVRAAAIGSLAIIGLSLYDVLGREAYRAFMMLSIISVCYLAVVAALVAMRTRRIA